MERHEIKPARCFSGAVRTLLGAGTMAVAMVATTAGTASAQTDYCVTEAPVCGHVFTDVVSSDGFFQVGEGTDDFKVVLVDGMNNPVETIQLNPQSPNECVDVNSPDCGYYEFAATTPGAYKVCIVLNGVPTDCRDVPEGTVGNTEDFKVNTGGGNSGTEDAPEPYTNIFGNGTGTPGYWKNHWEAWPVGGVTVGGIHYGNDRNVHPNIWDAIAIMSKAVKGDKTYSMFAALISAKLNLMPALQNNFDCIQGTLLKADEWMAAHAVGVVFVKAASPDWQSGADAWHQKLDDYNNGKLCAPHRD
jgi:hypothetical protein